MMKFFSGFLFATANVAYITAIIILHLMLDDVTWTKNVGLCWTNMVDPTNKGFNTCLDERLYSGLNLFSDFEVQKEVNGSTFSLLSRNKLINGKDIADEHAYVEGNTCSRIFIFSV